MKEKTEKVLKSTGLLSVANGINYAIFGKLIYKLVLTRKGVESPLVMKFTYADGSEDDYTKHLNAVVEEGDEWFKKQEMENLAIPATHFDKTIHANYLKCNKPSDLCALVIHGYSSYPSYMGVYVKKYLELGYNVLTPSLNGHGESEQQEITMGWDDRLDLIDWINYLIKRNPNVKIILHGVSMGAATTMMATGEALPENVKAAVEDCGYTSVWDMFHNKVVETMKLSEFMFLDSFNRANIKRALLDFKEASCIEQLKKSKTPTLFIHGANDDFIPPAMLDKVYDACPCEKEKLLVPKAIHARSVAADPELYWGTVTKFIEKYI